MLTVQETGVILFICGYIFVGIALSDWAYRIKDKNKPHKYSISCVFLWPIVIIMTVMYVIVECYRYIMHK